MSELFQPIHSHNRIVELMKKSFIAFVCGLLTWSGIQIVEAADVEAGKTAFETCRGCHSIPNYSNVYPTYYVPKIGGQRAEYIVSALKAYREQARPHGTMKANSYDLTDKTIENIAAYTEASVGKKNRAPADGNPAKGKELATTCVGCHTNKLKDGGNIPILAGQYGNYLVKVMKDYQTGKRNNPVMQSMLSGLTEEDLQDISAYFAYQTGLGAVE